MLSEIRNQIYTTENRAYSFVEKFKEKNVMLFGNGVAVQWYVKFLNRYNIMPVCIIDNNGENKKGYGEIPLYSLKQALEKFDNYVIVISAPKYGEEIREQLLTACEESRIFEFEAEIFYSFITNIDEYRDYLEENWTRFEKLYQILEDAKSKEVLEAFILGRLTANQDYFKSVMTENQYYTDELIRFTEQEVMVELGANNGETLLQFLEIVNRKYKAVYCFEPDKELINILNEIIKNEAGDIHLIEKGAWDKATTLSFASDASNGSSHIIENSGEKSYSIEVDSVDNCVKEDISYIKMDIEGAELKALQGSVNAIKQSTPTLAVCVYHNKEDLLDVAEYLKTIVPEYKLYLRHHNWGATETVLYAMV